MAERKRRGDDSVDDRLDEAFDDDTAVDDDDDDLIDDLDDDDDESVARGRGGNASLTKTRSRDKADTRPGTKGRSGRPGDKKKTKNKGERRNIFSRFANFVREVVAELRKVIWPTRKDLLTYTAVVVLFVTVMLTVVAGLDWVFGKGILWVFGNGKAE